MPYIQIFLFEENSDFRKISFVEFLFQIWRPERRSLRQQHNLRRAEPGFPSLGGWVQGLFGRKIGRVSFGRVSVGTMRGSILRVFILQIGESLQENVIPSQIMLIAGEEKEAKRSL